MTFPQFAGRLTNTEKSHGNVEELGSRSGCESLEDRMVLSQVGLTVSSLADSGPGSLRAAILAADAGRASDKFTIDFAVTGAINLQSPLPDLNNTIAIQGPGAGSLTVERDASYSFSSAIFTWPPARPRASPA